MGYYLPYLRASQMELSDAEVPAPAEELMGGSEDGIGQDSEEQHVPEEYEGSETDEGSENDQEFEPEIVQQFNYEPNWNAISLEDMVETGYSVDVPLLVPNTLIGSGDIWGAGCVPLRLSVENSPDGRLEDECYIFNFFAIARHLLKEVGAVPSETAVCDIAYALGRAVNVRSSMSLTECPRRGPLVLCVVADRAAGAVIGLGVGQLQPHPVVDDNGDYTGLEWHPEVRGFSINDDEERRRIVTKFIADAVIRLNEQNIR